MQLHLRYQKSSNFFSSLLYLSVSLFPFIFYARAISYGVDGYPSLRYFKDTEKRAMSGHKAGQTADEIANWAASVARSPPRIYKHLSSPMAPPAEEGGDPPNLLRDFAAAANRSASVVVVGVFSDAEHAEAFLEVAEEFPYPVRFGVFDASAYRHDEDDDATPILSVLGIETLEDARAIPALTPPEDPAKPGPKTESKAEGGGGNGAGEAALLGLKDVVNTVTLFKPFDEYRVATKFTKPLEGSKKSKTEMAEMMNKMMGVPHEEAMKLIPRAKEGKALSSWITRNMLPLLVPFADGYMDLIFEGPVKAHLLVIVEPPGGSGGSGGAGEEDPTANDDDAAAALEALVREAALATRGEVLHILMPAVKDTLDIRRFFGLDDSTPLPTAVFSDMRNSTDDAPQGKQFLLQTFLANESPGKGKKGSDAAVAERVALTADVLTKFARAGLDGDIGGSKGTKKSKGKKKSSKTAKKTPSAGEEL